MWAPTERCTRANEQQSVHSVLDDVSYANPHRAHTHTNANTHKRHLSPSYHPTGRCLESTSWTDGAPHHCTMLALALAHCAFTPPPLSGVAMASPIASGRRAFLGRALFGAAAAGAATSTLVIAPLPSFAVASPQQVLKSRAVYGSRVFRLQDATAAVIMDEKNVFDLFLTGAPGGEKEASASWPKPVPPSPGGTERSLRRHQRRHQRSLRISQRQSVPEGALNPGQPRSAASQPLGPRCPAKSGLFLTHTRLSRRNRLCRRQARYGGEW